MERKSFKPPEAQESSEDDDSSEVDEKENTTSTRTSERHTEKSDDQQEGAREQLAEAPRSLWRRITQELVNNDEPTHEGPTPEDPTRRIVTEFAANLEEENGEAPLGHLNTIEQHETAKAFIELRQQEIEDELGNLEPETIEARAATVAEHLLEATQQELDADPTIGVEEAADQAYRNTVRTDLPEAPEAIAARAVRDTEMYARTATAGEGNNVPPERFAHYLEDDNQDIRFPTPETPDGNGGNGNNGGDRNRDFQWGFGGSGYSNMPFRRRPPARDAANRAAAVTENMQARRQAAAVGIVAGVVGYLIGRRSGRIKTEKRLMAVQKKLEAEVRATYARLQGKEAQIRELAYTHLAPPPPERIQQSQQAKAVEAAPASKSKQEKQSVKPLEPTEHLGKTTLKALEARPAEIAKPRNIESISQHELIEMSEHITVGATNLRKVYETNLVSESGLRRIVGEYRRGGDVRRALAEEMLKKEMSYERDPMLRDKQLNTVEQATGGGRQSTAQPPSNMATEKETAIPQATSPASNPDTSDPSSKPPTQPALVIANIVALAILAVLVIVLFVVWIQKLI